VFIFIESRNQDDMDKKWSLDCIRRDPLSLDQGKVAQIKIMLRPSSFDEVEKRQKEESSSQAQVYTQVFFTLEYRSPYYEEGCNMVILTKPKCSKSKE
jgi:hypothetical protein